jgi:hypothetical protein
LHVKKEELMVGGTQELAPGGGGGSNRNLPPVANFDDEPDRRRPSEIFPLQYLVRYGDENIMGILPPDIRELYESRVVHLPKDAGSTALRGSGINPKGQSLN